jgi:hypothetical protein
VLLGVAGLALWMSGCLIACAPVQDPYARAKQEYEQAQQRNAYQQKETKLAIVADQEGKPFDGDRNAVN